jgi:RNA polymerase sigma factor (TIGR02999 family)
MSDENITKLLQEHTAGNHAVIDKLIPLVYEEMKQMAHHRLRGERSDHTFNTSALVHEAYLQLIDFDRIDWKNRDQFYGIASRVMRNILVDYAVKRNAQKRGGNRKRVMLRESDVVADQNLHDILSIHQALEKMANIDERQVRVVECRFFGGLTIKETAAALDISEATVNRDWKIARAWLNRELNDSTPEKQV